MRAAFVWSSIGNYSSFLLQLASVVILARILTPAEIGTYAIGAAILSIGQSFKDMGINQYLIREQNLSKEKKESVLSVSWFLCGSFALLIYLSSEPIAEFYNNPILLDVLPLLALNMLIIPLSLLAQANIRRTMRFKLLAGIETVAGIMHLVVAISLAVLGKGVFSLVFASLAGTLTTSLLAAWKNSSEVKYLPGTKRLKDVLGNLGFIGGSNILIMLQHTGTPLIIGKVLSESAVAIFDKAGALVNILDRGFFSGIQRVIVPMFSDMRRKKENAGAIYAELIQISLAVSWPFLFYLAIFPDVFVLLFYGSQWTDAIELIPYFCLSIALYNVSRYFTEYLISNDHEKIVFNVNLCVITVRILLLLFTAQYGLLFLAKIVLVGSVLRTLLTSYYIFKLKLLSVRLFIEALFKGTVTVIVSSVPLLVVIYFNIDVSQLLTFGLLGISATMFWCSSLYLTKNRLFTEVKRLWLSQTSNTK